jgi:2-dehydropantoate 2-reductase
MTSLNFLSIGAGAIGTYIGGSLALAGHSVTFVEQPSIVEILQERGLRLHLGIDPRRKQPDHALYPPAVKLSASLPQALAQTRYDAILFALKSFDTPVALQTLAPLYAADPNLPPVLCLQNGVENEPALVAALGAEKVIYGTVTSAVGRGGPGDITLEKLRGTGIAAGHPLSGALTQAFNDALLNCQLFPNPADMKWSKLLTNLLANPASAILNLTAAEIYAHPALYRLEIAQLRECLAVMKAQNIRVVDLPGTPVRALALAAALPLWLSKPFLAKAAGAGRGAKMPSFHIDLYAGRKQSEVTFLHGAVVRAGQQYGIPTPVNQLLTQTLLALAEGSLPLNAFDHQPEKLLARL